MIHYLCQWPLGARLLGRGVSDALAAAGWNPMWSIKTLLVGLLSFFLGARPPPTHLHVRAGSSKSGRHRPNSFVPQKTADVSYKESA